MKRIKFVFDKEIAALTDEAAARAEAILAGNREILDRLAEALLEAETLEEPELEPLLKDAKLPTAAKLH